MVKDISDKKRDLLIHDLRQKGTGSIHNMRAVNTDVLSQQSKSLKNFLLAAEKGENCKYLRTCFHQSHHVSLFVDSVEGLLGVEAEATLKCISSRLTTKWKYPYSRSYGYVNSRAEITFAIEIYCCIRGSQLPLINIFVQKPQGEDSAGLQLFWKQDGKRKNSQNL